MSNDIVPVLEHIDDEEHDKENCCVKYIDTKTFKGLEYFIEKLTLLHLNIN
jgi:hypothetical protein